MTIIVKNNKIGIAPRKMRQVCNLVRNKKASEAIKILRFCDKREISIVLTKLINSGLTIANNSERYDLDNLSIGTLCVDEGRTLKRFQPRAQGRAFKIRRRTSHITLQLIEN